MNGWQKIGRGAVCAAVWLLCAYVLTQLVEAFSFREWRWFSSPAVLGLNLMPWAGLLLLTGLMRSRRARAACAVGLGLAAAVIGIVNYYKMAYRLEPVLLTDVSQIGDAAQAVGLGFSIDFGMVGVVCGAFVLGIVLALVLVRGRERRRPLAAVIGACLLGLTPVLCTFGVSGGERTDLMERARLDGTVFTVFAVENYRREQMDIEYEETHVRAVWRDVQQQAQGAALLDEQQRPNVIFVLGESYANDDWLGRYLHLTEPLTPFFDELAATCQSGALYVPKIGGGTSETEFEVLTGMRSRYAMNPYSMGLPPTKSVASVLRDRGYYASAIHWHTGVFYNRYQNLRMLGFDSFCTTDTHRTAFEKAGTYVSDRAHYDAVMQRMADTPQRDFVFVLTMQGHGGYDYSDFGAAAPYTDELSDHSDLVMRNYCWLMQQSDAALRDFVGQLQAFDEPVLLVYFGDHIPPLGADVLAEIGAGDLGEQGHLTPYLIWSNRGNRPARVDLHAWQLAANALCGAGMGDDAFFHYIEQQRAAGAETGHAYDLLCYDALFGRQYAYDEEGVAPENTGFEVGGGMQLLGMAAMEIDGVVHMRPVLADPAQRYTLYVNGQKNSSLTVAPDGGAMTVHCEIEGANGAVLSRSNELTYDSAQQMLAQSDGLPCAVRTLEGLTFDIYRCEALEDYCLYHTVESVGADCALTVQGDAWQQRPWYECTAPGRWGLDDAGRLYVAVPKTDCDGGSAEGIHLFGREKDVKLYIFE